MSSILTGNPFNEPPDNYVGPTVRTDGKQDQSPVPEPLHPLAAARAVSFFSTALGLSFVFAGVSLLWGLPWGLLVVGLLLTAIGVGASVSRRRIETAE